MSADKEFDAWLTAATDLYLAVRNYLKREGKTEAQLKYDELELSWAMDNMAELQVAERR